MPTVLVECRCTCGGSGETPLPADQADAFVTAWSADHQGSRCAPSVIVVDSDADIVAADEHTIQARPEQLAWVERQLAQLDRELDDQR